MLLRYLLGSVEERPQPPSLLGDDAVEGPTTPAHLDVGLGALLGDIPAPYTVGYMAKDGSEACLSLNPPKAYYAWNEEAKLELEFKRYETYEDKRGVQTEGTAGMRHGGERIREATLTAFSLPCIFTSKNGVLNCINHN